MWIRREETGTNVVNISHRENESESRWRQTGQRGAKGRGERVHLNEKYFIFTISCYEIGLCATKSLHMRLNTDLELDFYSCMTVSDAPPPGVGIHSVQLYFAAP